MSNTAVANIAIPIFIGLMPGREPMVIIPIALAASTAMCLPISTPPNAIAYAQGRLTNRDFLAGGLLIGLIAPPLIVFWVKVMI